ncbi:MAG: Fur family transcriptional regulator [Pseudomonadota bacterium]
MSKCSEKIQPYVLAILRRRGGLLSAYDVHGELRKSHPKLALPTIYRALTALTERERAHRFEPMNAFIACQYDRHAQVSTLSICDDCGTVEESVSPNLLEEPSTVAEKFGFQPARHVIEIYWLCASCGAGQVPA